MAEALEYRQELKAYTEKLAQQQIIFSSKKPIYGYLISYEKDLVKNKIKDLLHLVPFQSSEEPLDVDNHTTYEVLDTCLEGWSPHHHKKFAEHVKTETAHSGVLRHHLYFAKKVPTDLREKISESSSIEDSQSKIGDSWSPFLCSVFSLSHGINSIFVSLI